jgi:hypothetical protein
MELYDIIASWAGWPVVVAVLLLAGGYSHWLLLDRINRIKEENDYLARQNDDLKNNSPDVLAEILAKKKKILMDELETLLSEKEFDKKKINEKEGEIKKVKDELDDLKGQLDRAQEFINEFSCPYCGAPLATREIFPMLGEYEGREIDYDVEIVTYECGLQIQDDKEIHQCQYRNA